MTRYAHLSYSLAFEIRLQRKPAEVCKAVSGMWAHHFYTGRLLGISRKKSWRIRGTKARFSEVNLASIPPLSTVLCLLQRFQELHFPGSLSPWVAERRALTCDLEGEQNLYVWEERDFTGVFFRISVASSKFLRAFGWDMCWLSWPSVGASLTFVSPVLPMLMLSSKFLCQVLLTWSYRVASVSLIQCSSQ